MRRPERTGPAGGLGAGPISMTSTVLQVPVVGVVLIDLRSARGQREIRRRLDDLTNAPDGVRAVILVGGTKADSGAVETLTRPSSRFEPWPVDERYVPNPAVHGEWRQDGPSLAQRLHLEFWGDQSAVGTWISMIRWPNDDPGGGRW